MPALKLLDAPARRSAAETVAGSDPESAVVVDEFKLLYSPCDIVTRAAREFYPNMGSFEAVALAIVLGQARERGCAFPDSMFRGAWYALREDGPARRVLVSGDALRQDARNALARCALDVTTRERLRRFGFHLDGEAGGVEYRNPLRPPKRG